jgi:membrane protease YdiL (CAAX protease family)
VDEVIKQLRWEGLAYAIVAGAALLVLFGLFAFVPALRRRWLPLPRLRPGVWTGNEVFFAFCIMLGFPTLIVEILLRIGFFTPLIGPAPALDDTDMERAVYGVQCVIVSSPLSLTVILGMVLGMMYARTGTRPHRYGLTWGRPVANAVLGLLAFVASRPVLIGIFLLAALVFPARPDDPLLELATRGMPEWEWALIAFQTIVAAPILEEVLCRGILQGWLRRATLAGQIGLLAMALFLTVFVNQAGLGRLFASLAFISLLAVGYACALMRLRRQFALNDDELKDWQVLPSRPPLDSALTGGEEEAWAAREQARARDEARATQWADANATLAILGSALFFAAMHSNWPGPIALFPMGLMLGWMARRTQSLIGPITFHALFNLTTFIALYASALSGD